MTDFSRNKLTTLANGGSVPLEAASIKFGLLTEYLAEPDSDWDVVYYLRKLCLGQSIEPEQRRALIKEELLDPDGTLDPVMQAVVLSAVRGEGRVLHLASPFTDPLDRAVSEFLTARDVIRAHLSEREAKALFDYDPGAQVIDALRTRQKPWSERENDRPPPSDSPDHPR